MKASFIIKFVATLAFIVILIAPFTFNKIKKTVVKEQELTRVKVDKPKVIEQALHSVILPDFSNILDVKEKKRQFFDFIRPTVINENQKLLDTRQRLTSWLEKASLEEPLSAQEQEELSHLVKTYKVNKKYTLLQQLNELLMRIDIVPTALVLVQAANESAWGTSRFARIGLNFFGIWCYRPSCGMVPAGRNSGAKHEVAAFQSVQAAVKRYLYNINTHNAYIMFRTIREQLRAQNQPLQPEVLATGLLPYSERGTDYVLEITEMIRHNRFYLEPKQSE